MVATFKIITLSSAINEGKVKIYANKEDLKEYTEKKESNNEIIEE